MELYAQKEEFEQRAVIITRVVAEGCLEVRAMMAKSLEHFG